MKKLLTISILSLSSAAFAQTAVRVDIPLLTSGPNVPTSGGPLPQALWLANATVKVCTHPSTINSCTPLTTYTDSTEATSCPSNSPLTRQPGTICTATTGSSAGAGFWYAGGLADYYVTSAYGTQGPYTVSSSNGSGSGTVSGQASGVIPLATNSTTVGAQSHIADSGTAIAVSEPTTLTLSDSPNLLQIQDPNLGQTHQGNYVGALQPQNYYALNSTYTGIANMLSGSGNSPSQLRILLNGDSTTGFHNLLVACQLAAMFGSVGYDFGGLNGVQTGYGQPCNTTNSTTNSTTGIITSNNGSGSIVPGTGAPYDFTRSPTGAIYNITSGGSITFGSGGVPSYGNVLKVYALKEPTDGIYGLTPGTMTVTATSSSTGICPAGCAIFSGSLSNGSSIGFVTQTIETADDLWTITVAASGGAIDVYAVGIYDNLHNGVISSGGTGRGGLSLPDSVSTPTAITAPWYASATGAPATVTAYSCSGTTGTFTSAQSYVSGMKVILGGFSTSTFLNGASVTITSASGTQFVGTTTACSGSLSATESGIAMSSDSMALIMFEMKQNGISGGTGGCQQATTAAPTTFQTYLYWLGLYKNQWTSGNPLVDFEFTGSYDGGSSCAPVFNDQERQLAQTNGYFYYDNYFPASWTKMEQIGMIGNSVHSSAAEQIGHSVQLWSAMGLDSFLGAEQKNVAATVTQTQQLWLGSSDPRASVQGLCNPASSICSQPVMHGYADTNGLGNYNYDNTDKVSWWDYDHINCWLIMVFGNGGSTPTCGVTINHYGTTGSQMTMIGVGPNGFGWGLGAGTGSGSFNLWNTTVGGGNATTSMLVSNISSQAANYYGLVSGNTIYWRVGMLGNSAYSIKDDIGGKVVLNFPSNTMPVNSISGNANGATLLTINTATNCAVNSVSPAACGSAASGAIVVPTTTTTYTVNTSAVTAASRIFLFPMSFASNLPSSPTCVVPAVTSAPTISAISAATSFTITLPSTTGQTCWSYEIVN